MFLGNESAYEDATCIAILRNWEFKNLKIGENTWKIQEMLKIFKNDLKKSENTWKIQEMLEKPLFEWEMLKKSENPENTWKSWKSWK